MRAKKTLTLILITTILAAYIAIPRKIDEKISLFGREYAISYNIPSLNFALGPIKVSEDFNLQQGLDIAGGVYLVFNVSAQDLPEDTRGEALKSLEENIRRRVDIYGLGEVTVRTVQSVDGYRLIVEIPGEIDPQQAISLIGETAQLNFRLEQELAPEATASATVYDLFGQETGLNGALLKKSTVVFDPNTGSPQIAISFNDAGREKFAGITKDNVGKRLAIFLDEFVLMAPVINEPILNGDAVISGSFEINEANLIASQLNAGALPVDLELVEQNRISPTLGQSSLRKGIIAGLVGVVIEAIFMIAIYGRLGFLAIVGLVIFGIWSVALYKIIPVTLTMPGIAGFLLSLGMAVDSNILIFERMKEELRGGKPLKIAMELGFGRAWDSIRDANVNTLIICFVLFNPFEWSFLNTSGMVRGFAITLGLGIFLELFTSIVVVRNIMRVFYTREVSAGVKSDKK